MTIDELKEARFCGPVRFLDGARGMAQQDFECVANPRFGYSWRREHRKDPGRQFYTVDGKEVASIEAAAALLGADPDPESPREAYRRHVEEFKASPRIGVATRALSEARVNADAVPFGMVRAWMQRAEDAWHHGINRYAEAQRKAGASFDSYRWLYDAKSAAHEAYRLMYLFHADREKDTRLVCALGTRCRDCPILQSIETAMVAEQANERFPRDLDDADIDAAKVWTCLSHIQNQNAHVLDGGFLANDRDRQAYDDEIASLAQMTEAVDRGEL